MSAYVLLIYVYAGNKIIHIKKYMVRKSGGKIGKEIKAFPRAFELIRNGDKVLYYGSNTYF